MAGGLFDKAISTWEAMFGTDELRAAIDDERSENALLEQRIVELQWELRTARGTIATLEGENMALRQQLAERSGDTVRQQYGEVDAWREAAKDMVT